MGGPEGGVKDLDWGVGWGEGAMVEVVEVVVVVVDNSMHTCTHAHRWCCCQWWW